MRLRINFGESVDWSVYELYFSDFQDRLSYRYDVELMHCDVVRSKDGAFSFDENDSIYYVEIECIEEVPAHVISADIDSIRDDFMNMGYDNVEVDREDD